MNAQLPLQRPSPAIFFARTDLRGILTVVSTTALFWLTGRCTCLMFRIHKDYFATRNMVASVEKALRLLEFLAAEGARERPLAEIAEGLDLNKATCSHLLKTLVELGYAEQSGPRKGYRLGPMAYMLSRGAAYRRDLVAAAEPRMADLAREVRETVLLAVLRRGRRFTLCQIDGTQDVQVRAEPVATAHGGASPPWHTTTTVNVYETATGRLLLAHSAEDEVAAFVRANGLPGSRWPAVTDEASLASALAEIRGAGRVVNVTPTHVVGIAYPVRQDGRVVAALGLYLPEFRFGGEHKGKVLGGMEHAAAAVSSRLTAPVGSAAKEG